MRQSWASIVILLFFGLLSISHRLNARAVSIVMQNPTIDSLYRILPARSDTVQVNVLNSIALASYRYSPLKTQEYASKALVLARSLHHINGEILALNNLGIAAFSSGAYASALDHYIKALRLADSINTLQTRADIINNIGLVYCETANYKDAIRYFEKALAINRELGNTKNYGSVANNIGDLYFNQKDYVMSLVFYIKADSARNVAVGHSSAVELVNLGRCYVVSTFDVKKGLEYIHKGIARSEIDKDNISLLYALTFLGQHYLEKEKNSELSRRYLLRADSIAQEFNLLISRIEALKILAKAEKLSGNIVRALEVREQLTVLRDSLIFNRRAEMIGRVEELHRYEISQNEQAIEMLNRERERDSLYKIILTVAVTIMSGALIAGAWQYRKRRIGDRVVEERNVEISRINTDLQAKNEELQKNTQYLHVLNKALQQTNIEFENANQMKLKILSVASHDLKNPLMNVRALAEILTQSNEGENREFAKEIEQLSVRMLDMIGDLLDRAAMESGNFVLNTSELLLSDVVRATVRQFTPLAEKKQQTLTLQSEEGVVMIGDERRLRQAIDNLISNAIKYAPSATDITIRLYHANDERIRFEVQDQGPGLTEEDKLKAFGFFQKLSAKPTAGESSHGVGLSSVKQIVELHEGIVWIESEYGHGATFIVELPVRS